jgi:hypothetical protein
LKEEVERVKKEYEEKQKKKKDKDKDKDDKKKSDEGKKDEKKDTDEVRLKLRRPPSTISFAQLSYIVYHRRRETMKRKRKSRVSSRSAGMATPWHQGRLFDVRLFTIQLTSCPAIADYGSRLDSASDDKSRSRRGAPSSRSSTSNVCRTQTFSHPCRPPRRAKRPAAQAPAPGLQTIPRLHEGMPSRCSPKNCISRPSVDAMLEATLLELRISCNSGDMLSIDGPRWTCAISSQAPV